MGVVFRVFRGHFNREFVTYMETSRLLLKALKFYWTLLSSSASAKPTSVAKRFAINLPLPVKTTSETLFFISLYK